MDTTSGPAASVVITRVFDAPRELVFRAWTDPKHMAAWWGPHGFTNPVCELDPRPGGKLLIVMRSPEGVENPVRGVFQEFVPPARLVFTTRAFEDAAGNARLEGVNTVTFTEADGKTTVTLHGVILWIAPELAGALAGMEAGWSQSLDRLAELVARVRDGSGDVGGSPTVGDIADREIVITRLVDAPRERVFAAWTDPEQVTRWWGPKGFTTTTHEMDVRPGGVWRFIMHAPDGTDYRNRTTYIEVAPPERLVYAHDSDGEDDAPPFHTRVTFEERDGKTLVTLRSLFATAEICRRTREFGAVEGGNSTLDCLEEYLGSPED